MEARILFIHFGLAPHEQRGIEDAVRRESYHEVSTINPSSVLIRVDDDLYYVVDDEILKERLARPDIPLNMPVVPDENFLLQTQLRTNVIVCAKGHFSPVYYSFGNLFGRNSILLGKGYELFVDSGAFDAMKGRELQNVRIVRRSDGTFVVAR